MHTFLIVVLVIACGVTLITLRAVAVNELLHGFGLRIVIVCRSLYVT